MTVLRTRVPHSFMTPSTSPHSFACSYMYIYIYIHIYIYIDR